MVTADVHYEVGRLISYLAATDDQFAKVLTIRDDLGRRVVVPAVPDDTIHGVTKLIEQAGGAAIVMVMYRAEAGMTLLGLELEISRDDESGGDHHVPVPPTTTVGDLLAFLEPGSSITFRLQGEELSVRELTRRDVADALVVV